MINKPLLAGLMLLSSFASAASAWDKISGQSAGVKQKTFVVVRSQAEWSALWAKHTAGKAQARPCVDFSKEMVVAVFLGERNQGGTKVEVTVMADPLEPQSRMVVFYREVPPASGRFNMQMLSQPFVMVKVPLKAKVDFEEDQAMSIPERPAAPQSIFSPEEKMRILKTMDGLQAMAADARLFR
ncbi:MAG: protease complex subunit PrcB family protein [Elusimicrobia bacterium]|nr:protease complex subunit PrcB family protein [Elusimicrobiota bacterium]